MDKNSKILDLGAGLGRHLLALKRAGIPFKQLVAWEPNYHASLWLRRLAEGNPRILIAPGASVDSGLNYVDRFSSIPDGHDESRASNFQGLYQCANDAKFNCIWSSSVFTHMWPKTAKETLSCFRTISEHVNSIQINTWLILDDKAKTALSNGTADRKLSLHVNGIFTYSADNPLVCTAYSYSDVCLLYQQAGLKIVDIHWGSWRGGVSIGVHYQDIVISQPL